MLMRKETIGLKVRGKDMPGLSEISLLFVLTAMANLAVEVGAEFFANWWLGSGPAAPTGQAMFDPVECVSQNSIAISAIRTQIETGIVSAQGGLDHLRVLCMRAI
ncbi:MAG: hypothetical protein HQ481_08490 [Alphaproteobacteria bacterium]|nr:hypothetical protein [Alphaproteobacteria bacterium]